MSNLSPMRTDRELLADYAESGSDSAFAALVERHGRMVYRTCLRSLGNEHDAEEAAQAVFMVLVHKRKALGSEGELAAWLHRVARNVAHLALRSRARRSRHEEAAAMVMATGGEGRVAAGAADGAAVMAQLDRELDALPAAQRQAVVLRYLEGLPQEEAARLAGCPQGTLARRAQLGLERLRERLCQRGQVLSVAALAALLATDASAAAPATLLPSILSVPKLAASGAAAGAAGGMAHTLAQGVIKMMFWTKVKLAVAVSAVVLALGGGGGLVAAKLMAGETTAPKAAPVPTPAPAPAAEVKAIDGLKVTLSADKEKLEAGQTLKLTVTFENVSDERMSINVGKLGSLLQATGPDAESVATRALVFQANEMLGLGSFIPMMPNTKRSFDIVFVGNPPATQKTGATRIFLAKPGVYTFKMAYANDIAEYEEMAITGRMGAEPRVMKVAVPGKVWKGTFDTGSVKVEFTGKFESVPAEQKGGDDPNGGMRPMGPRGGPIRGIPPLVDPNAGVDR